MINPIAVAIPGFLVAITTELLVAKKRGRLGRVARERGDLRPIYRTADALTDLGCGLVSQVTGLLTSGVVTVALYAALSSHSPLPYWPVDSWLAWLAAFVVVDFQYYWWHRTSHRCNLFWAAHVVHHQSEDYNLAVALRQAIFTPLTSLPFYLPLALIGIPSVVFLTCSALNTLYQFWIHTRLVSKLPLFETIFNSPSHHRVHHGINPVYIDRNHAGVFIVWDKLFGTFIPEGDEPVYGVVEGFPAYSVLSANFAPYAKLARNAWAARGMNKLRLLFGPPEWRPPELGGPVTIPEPTPALRFDPRVPGRVQRYCAAWFAPMAVVLFFVLWYAQTAPWPLLALGGGFIVGTQTVHAGLLEGRAWARPAEVARLVAVAAIGGILLVG
jgi:sterol desaturase/sphingolipid hydroxylase (fatty acid hydroxylase superfamily)